MAARSSKPKCRTIDGVTYRLVPMATPCRAPAKAKPPARRKAAPPPRAADLSSGEFNGVVRRAALLTPAYHPNASKALLHDVYRTAKPDLGGMTLAEFKDRLRVERFPLERIDLPEVLPASDRNAAEFFGRGPNAIRNRK